MQIASDAFAFRDCGQMFNFFVGLAQAAIHAIALGEERISRADDDGKQAGIENGPGADVQQPRFAGADGSDADESDDGSPSAF